MDPTNASFHVCPLLLENTVRMLGYWSFSPLYLSLAGHQPPLKSLFLTLQITFGPWKWHPYWQEDFGIHHLLRQADEDAKWGVRADGWELYVNALGREPSMYKTQLQCFCILETDVVGDEKKKGSSPQ